MFRISKICCKTHPVTVSVLDTALTISHITQSWTNVVVSDISLLLDQLRSSLKDPPICSKRAIWLIQLLNNTKIKFWISILKSSPAKKKLALLSYRLMQILKHNQQSSRKTKTTPETESKNHKDQDLINQRVMTYARRMTRAALRRNHHVLVRVIRSARQNKKINKRPVSICVLTNVWQASVLNLPIISRY